MVRGSDKSFDIVVVGAGPAGLAAAIRARQLDRSVLLLDRARFPRPRICNGWLGPAGVAAAKECGLSAKVAGATTFKGLTLHAWDFKKSAKAAEADLCGWIVERSTFDAALLALAQKAGAEVMQSAEPVELTLADERVTLRMSSGKQVGGRVLLIGDGLQSATAKLARLSAAGHTPAPTLSRHVSFELSKAAEPGIDVALGSPPTGPLATIVRAGTQVRVTVVLRGGEEDLNRVFSEFCKAAQETGLLPAKGAGKPSDAPAPLGLALDLETHVGKRCLLIGDAGGFVAAFSNEGIYPAMKSGWIAAEAAARSLSAPVMQDELAGFSAAWRGELADYLRMPNTDLSLLLPLVFSNPQMSKRVARAFLLGQKF